MKMMTRRIPFFVLPVVMFALLCMTAAPAKAVELFDSKLEIHGFGHQGFLLTNHNKFSDADNKGSFNFNTFGLLFNVQPQENTTIWAQLFTSEEANVRLDWAFVDYKFSDQFRVRGGQVRDPVGLLSETRDVKYLQLSSILPYMYQEDAELIGEAFRGASLIYTPEALDGDVSIDVFGGQPVEFEEDEDKTIRNLFGGRISYKTPIEGLTLLASASTSYEDKKDEPEESGYQNLYVGSVSYKNHNLDLRSEFLWQTDAIKDRMAYYAQAGYTFFDKLTPFARYDYIVRNIDERRDPERYQKGFVFGLDYKFNSNIAFKIEDHINKGFAAADDIDEDEGEGRKNWNLFAASLNFIF